MTEYNNVFKWYSYFMKWVDQSKMFTNKLLARLLKWKIFQSTIKRNLGRFQPSGSVKNRRTVNINLTRKC